MGSRKRKKGGNKREYMLQNWMQTPLYCPLVCVNKPAAKNASVGVLALTDEVCSTSSAIPVCAWHLDSSCKFKFM
jgi:hypothetical protein